MCAWILGANKTVGEEGGGVSPGVGRSFLMAYDRGASSNPWVALSGGPKPVEETFGVRPEGIRRTFQILYGELCTLPQILYDKFCTLPQILYSELCTLAQIPYGEFCTLPHLISRRIF